VIEEALFMWDKIKSSRFRQLRQRLRDGELLDAEQEELALLTQELEATEASYLAPATERLRQVTESIEGQNRALEVLGRRKEALALRLRNFLVEAQAERQAIESEFTAVLAGIRGSEMGD
jgi:hypothetical protein